MMKTVGTTTIHGKPDAMKVARPVWGEVHGNLLSQESKASWAYSTLPAIAGLTRQLGFDEAADWLNDRRNRRTYAQGIFRGFAPEGE